MQPTLPAHHAQLRDITSENGRRFGGTRYKNIVQICQVYMQGSRESFDRLRSNFVYLLFGNQQTNSYNSIAQNILESHKLNQNFQMLIIL